MLTSNSIPRQRQLFKRLTAATALPDPLRTYEEWEELQEPGQDLAGANRLELRLALQAAGLSLLVNRGCVIYMDAAGRMITAEHYLLGRIAAKRHLWRAAG